MNHAAPEVLSDAHRSRTMRSAASTRRISSKLRNPTLVPSRPGSTAAACSASTRVFTPPISTSDESWRHEPTGMLVQPATSTWAVDLTGLPRRSGNRTACDRDSPAGHATERLHHARNVSMSRSTCIASARSDSSSASLSASARIAAPAFRRAASIRGGPPANFGCFNSCAVALRAAGPSRISTRCSCWACAIPLSGNRVQPCH